MMGHRTKQFKLFPPTNLDALVPRDNFYRQLEAGLDLSFVRELVRERYEELGRPWLQAEAYRELPAYQRALRKRKEWLEPLFGEAKVFHGLRRFRLRGLHKANYGRIDGGGGSEPEATAASLGREGGAGAGFPRSSAQFTLHPTYLLSDAGPIAPKGGSLASERAFFNSLAHCATRKAGCSSARVTFGG